MDIENTQKCTIQLPPLGDALAQVLKPGSNEVPPATWDNALKNATVKQYVDLGYLVAG